MANPQEKVRTREGMRNRTSNTWGTGEHGGEVYETGVGSNLFWASQCGLEHTHGGGVVDPAELEQHEKDFRKDWDKQSRK